MFMYGYELLINVYSLFFSSNVSVSKGIGTVSIEYKFKVFGWQVSAILVHLQVIDHAC